METNLAYVNKKHRGRWRVVRDKVEDTDRGPIMQGLLAVEMNVSFILSVVGSHRKF